MTDPGPEATACPPTTRAEALALLRKVDYDLTQIGPEEIAAIRKAFGLSVVPRECTLTGETPMSSKKFADAMRERPGIGEHKDRAGIRYWVGISRPGQETLGGGE